jgi:hypothetical protein
VKAFRRGVFVASLAVLASAIVKMLSNRDHTQPENGGWRQLDGPDFR